MISARTHMMARRHLTPIPVGVAPPRESYRRRHRAGSRTGLVSAVEVYFRSADTLLARVLAHLGPSSGAAYSASRAKRSLDLAVALPLAVITIALIALLMLVNRVLSPHRPALFRQDRVGPSGDSLRVLKIRSMVTGPGVDAQATVCTAFGRFIRRYHLDELPQLLQVLTGRLSLVGIRVLPRNVYEGLAESWSSERFAAWQAMYAAAPLGLSGTHQVFRRTGKEDSRRFHRDMFYARHASIGFDLYLLWRTLGSRDKEVPYGPAQRSGLPKAA
jgi:lipopolysaccharide/colanic/teichoic acid biosynthesis glycosyltransferase